MVNICLCGSMAGYPHAADCPRPLFRAGQDEQTAWLEERKALRAKIEEDETSGLTSMFALMGAEDLYDPKFVPDEELVVESLEEDST